MHQIQSYRAEFNSRSQKLAPSNEKTQSAQLLLNEQEFCNIDAPQPLVADRKHAVRKADNAAKCPMPFAFNCPFRSTFLRYVGDVREADDGAAILQRSKRRQSKSAYQLLLSMALQLGLRKLGAAEVDRNPSPPNSRELPVLDVLPSLLNDQRAIRVLNGDCPKITLLLNKHTRAHTHMSIAHKTTILLTS